MLRTPIDLYCDDGHTITDTGETLVAAAGTGVPPEHLSAAGVFLTTWKPPAKKKKRTERDG